MAQPQPTTSGDAPPPYQEQPYPPGFQYGNVATTAPPGAYNYPGSTVVSMPPGGYAYGTIPPTGVPYTQPSAPPAGTVYYQVDAASAPKYGAPHHGHSSIHSSGSHSHHDESDDEFREGFSERHIRHGFLKKVYGILCIQILITGALMSIFIFVDSVREYVQQQSWVFITAMCILFVLLIVLACCDHVRRRFPLNIVLLMFFTIAEGIMLGTISAFYDTETVLLAAGIVAVLVLALTVFALQTKWDFTICSAGLFIFLICLLIFGMLCAIIQNRYVDIVYASLGALLFAFYLVVDTQMMLGGKHKYTLSPEEYIFAALNLYLDIINIFLYVLAILGLARN